MDRSMKLPFAKGEFDIKLEVTGPLCDTEGAEFIIDDMFRKANHDLHKCAVPSMNTLADKVETTDGKTETDALLEIEILGTQVRLNIGILLNFGVDPDLARSMVTQSAAPDFAHLVIDTIASISLTTVAADETRVQMKPRPMSPLGDFLGGLIGEGALLRVG